MSATDAYRLIIHCSQRSEKSSANGGIVLFVDTETCGLHGPCVLIQYAENDNEIKLHEVFHTPARETLELIEYICTQEVCGFNLAFDWFHLCKIYGMLSLLNPDDEPVDHIDKLAKIERKAINGPCLKPLGALDLMLVARKGPYQSTMDRKDIRIKKIPAILSVELCLELSRRIVLDKLYFSRRKDAVQWKVVERPGEPEFRDIVLKFAPSASLKNLAKHALGIDDTQLFADVGVHKGAMPVEQGWAPYAPNTVTGWPAVIRTHINHWRYNDRARQYATNDIVYTRLLYAHLDHPPANDVDSTLSTMVGACRWRGYQFDRDGIRGLRLGCLEKIKNLPFNPNAAASVKAYLLPVMSLMEQESLKINGKFTTKRMVLEQLAKWCIADVCPDCKGMGCDKCDEGIIDTNVPHPAALRAREVLTAREMGKEIELYDKLLAAERFHASFKVIGTLSGRMAGADGLNAQGIKSAKYVRKQFKLAHSGLKLIGGDFKSFEVVLADAAYRDPKLRHELVSGKSIHGLFGRFLFPPMTYDEIMATKGQPGEKDKYKRSKNGVFALLYGGEASTLGSRVGVSEDAANTAYQMFIKEYEKVGENRKMVTNMFCSMRQPEGLGTRVVWHDPDDYIESLFGFRRYFTLENSIVKALFDLAEKPPKEWLQYKIQVVRRDRLQTVGGACRSALFGAAFAVQAANMRAAANHVIQSSGAELTKRLQARLWELQPTGVNNWMIQPFNVHDEIMCPIHPSLVEAANKIVVDFVQEYKSLVPLLEIDWSNNLETWADK